MATKKKILERRELIHRRIAAVSVRVLHAEPAELRQLAADIAEIEILILNLAEVLDGKGLM